MKTSLLVTILTNLQIAVTLGLDIARIKMLKRAAKTARSIQAKQRAAERAKLHGAESTHRFSVRLKRSDEIELMAAYYGQPVAVIETLWAAHGTKPDAYQCVLGVDTNAKTSKGRALGYMTGIVYFAPANASGYNVCGWADPNCIMACLHHEGRARVNKNIKPARMAKTRRYFEARQHFMACLFYDVFQMMRQACKLGLIPCVRPNGTSDIVAMAHAVAREFSFLQVYDYTKRPKPHLYTLPNYHLTFSRSGNNDSACLEALKNGINVTVVFAKGFEKPTTYWGYKVIDGDKTDLRFLDETGVIVGLTSKGISHTKNAAPFIISTHGTDRLPSPSPNVACFPSFMPVSPSPSPFVVLQ